MERKERVKAAIAHRETERIPYFIDLTAEMTEHVQETLGVPVALDWLDNDVAFVRPPWWKWHQLGPDWRAPATPTSRAQVIGTGSYEAYVEQIKQAAESGKYVLVRISGCHFEKGNSARGIENFLADMAADPSFARRLLTLIIDRNLVMLDNLLALPEIDGVMLGSDWGSQHGLLMSPATWQEMIRPGEQRMYDLVRSYGKDVWLHSCGNIERIIPSLIEMGLNVLNPVQPEVMDISRLKREYGKQLTFWGGISTQQTLPFSAPEEVKMEVRRVRDEMSRGGGYILAPAQHVQRDVPLENLMALLEVARETCGNLG
jgi:uroporphyrinogen decarboxylase